MKTDKPVGMKLHLADGAQLDLSTLRAAIDLYRARHRVQLAAQAKLDAREEGEDLTALLNQRNFAMNAAAEAHNALITLARTDILPQGQDRQGKRPS